MFVSIRYNCSPAELIRTRIQKKKNYKHETDKTTTALLPHYHNMGREQNPKCYVQRSFMLIKRISTTSTSTTTFIHRKKNPNIKMYNNNPVVANSKTFNKMLLFYCMNGPF